MLISFIGSLLSFAVDVCIVFLVLNYIMAGYFFMKYIQRAEKIKFGIIFEMLIPYNVLVMSIFTFLYKGGNNES
jgi:ABC-type glycerol-3-phosphate transport system permease component